MLGEFLTGLSYKHDQSVNLPRLVAPYMDALLKKFDETVNLGVLDGNKIKYLHSVESSQRLRSGNPHEEKDNVHSTALGKAILSTQSDDQVLTKFSDVEFKQYTKNSLT